MNTNTVVSVADMDIQANKNRIQGTITLRKGLKAIPHLQFKRQPIRRKIKPL